MNYSKLSETIIENLNLETSPVSVKLFADDSDCENELEKSDRIMHCQAIITASKGKIIYATQNELGCPIGASVLGLREISEKFLSGLQFDKMNVTETRDSGKNLFASVAKMNERVKAIAYMPLEDTKWDPDVVVIVAKPRQIFDLIRANAYKDGKRMDNSVGGTQSLCADIVVNSILTNEPHISFGCMGSHMATELKEDEVIIGIPISKLEELASSLDIVNKRG